jgi:hypothetical protein
LSVFLGYEGGTARAFRPVKVIIFARLKIHPASFPRLAEDDELAKDGGERVPYIITGDGTSVQPLPTARAVEPAHRASWSPPAIDQRANRKFANCGAKRTAFMGMRPDPDNK